MKQILTDAASIGAVTARTLAFRMRDPKAYYPNNSWRLPFFGGYKFEVAPGVSNLDGATFFNYFATGVTPAMEEKMVGQGSQYPWAAQETLVHDPAPLRPVRAVVQSDLAARGDRAEGLTPQVLGNDFVGRCGVRRWVVQRLFRVAGCPLYPGPKRGSGSPLPSASWHNWTAGPVPNPEAAITHGRTWA